MSSSSTHRMPWRGAMLLAVLGLVPLSAGEPARSHVARSEGGESRRPLEVSTYEEPGGETYLAVSVKLAELPQGEISRRDHVLLVDTSASQVGEHRQQALAVAKAFLDSLPAGHRVAVYAVDLQTRPLTEGFVPVRGADSQAALAQLDRRLPLGATNLAGALNRALGDIEAGESSSILYIGDGMSAANLLPLEEFQNLTQELKGRKVPVHSYAVGPRTDLQLLGSLALQTGGYVQYDMANERLDAPSRVGERLAQAVTAPIYYPESVTVEPAGLSVLPKTALPMRADRSTVYLAKGQVTGGVTVRVSGGGASQTLSVPQTDFEGGQTFLRNHYQQAEKTGGLSVAYAGNRLLRTAQSAFDNQVAAMVSAGERAVTALEYDKAEEIGLAVKNADPKNAGAQVLLAAARKGQARTRTVAFQQNQPSLLDKPEVQKLGQPEPIDQTLPPGGPGAGLIPTVEQEIAIKTQRLTLEVNRAIEEANNVALTSPDEALETLKFALGAVQDATDIIPEARAQLLRRVRSKQLELQTKKRLIEENQIALAERQAAIEAQQRLIDLASEQELELEQLIDRVRALMEEGYHGNDDAFEEAEAVAEAAVDLQPGEGTSAAAVFSAEAAGQLNKAFRLRALRRDKFLEVLYQVELSHVPFPDEPPILWPPAPVWRALTERRKKWASVDLHKNSPAEEKIQAALIDPQGVEIEFIDTPLKDAMDFIADAHGITIIVDEQALTEEGVSIDEPINRILSGVTLRSALKIILEPVGLTYVIEDEVMKITTIIAAEDKLSTRVYPVGDLVVPVMSGMMARMMLGGMGMGMGGGMGMMGGGMGMMGGGMGGMGGMGMGGMGGGMGMMGGGMGMMNIAPQPIPHAQQNPAANPPAQPGQAAPRHRRPDPEVENLLDRILENGTSQTTPESFQPQWFAQIQDGGFRLDNKAVQSLKKKVK